MLSSSKNVLQIIEIRKNCISLQNAYLSKNTTKVRQNTGTNMCLKYFQIKDPIEKEETAKRYTDMYVVLVLNGNDQ